MNNNYDKILKLGLIKVNLKKYDESKKYFLKLIKLDDKRYEGYLNLSNILVVEKKHKEAKDLLEKYLKKNDPHSEIVSSLAMNLFNSNNYNELSKHVDLYLVKYDNYLLNYLKGFCLNNIYNNTQSEIFLKKSISLNNTFWPPYELLFRIYDKRSKLSEMEALMKKSKIVFSKNHNYSYFEALYYYRISKHAKSNQILFSKEISNFIQNNDKSIFIADYFNLLSKNYEKLLDHKKCFNYALKRNNILINLEKNKGFDKKDLLDTIDSYLNFFNTTNRPLFKSKHVGLEHSNLTFLIGFPRSGTTLLDTILRAHSKTMVIEEKPYLLNLRHDFFKKNNLFKLLDLDEDYKIKIQDQYFNSFNYDPNKVVIDKFPLNLLELGFIKTIFPNSKIILAIRHPLDCIISCVLTAFKINEAMLNFENLETTALFYNKVFKLLNKYIEFFNINLHQIKYEHVVSDFDNQIKKLLNYINLEFEDSVISFYDTAKKREQIHTPSYDQVVKPLYSNSINRHLNFNDIKKIIPEVEKWITYYSYNKP